MSHFFKYSYLACLCRHHSFSHCWSHRGSLDCQRVARWTGAQTGTVYSISGSFSLSSGRVLSTIRTKEPHLSHPCPGTLELLPGRCDPSDHPLPADPLSTGLYCNHQDLSEQYSSLLLGITNTAGALTGVLGARLVLMDETERRFV